MRRLVALLLAMSAVSTGLYFLIRGSGDGADQVAAGNEKVLRVLAYSAFVNDWGPGPAIAKAFEKEYGLKVEYDDAGDAGLILKKINLVPADVVVGLDQLILSQARVVKKWRSLFEQLPVEIEPSARHADFLPFDWAPMSFIYRTGEVAPPTSLLDLLDSRFTKAITLEDPRTSTPGLQFLFWVLDEMGVEPGFEFLARLKPNIYAVADSWSAAYGMFTRKQAKLSFSYLTSPVYHWTEEKNRDYAPAVFSQGHAVQIEYAGVPDTCYDCVGARLFALFLLRPEIQKIIMEKNYMFPMISGVTKDTAFETLPRIQVRKAQNLEPLLQQRDELLERWRRLGL
jgi:thiamine transport system substrate-binding protein